MSDDDDDDESVESVESVNDESEESDDDESDESDESDDDESDEDESEESDKDENMKGERLRFCYGVLSSGSCYEQTWFLFLLGGLPFPIGKTTFYRHQEVVLAAYTAERNKLLDARIAALAQSGVEVRISIDCRWSHRRNAMAGTVSCFNLKSSKLLDLQHVGKPELICFSSLFLYANIWR